MKKKHKVCIIFPQINEISKLFLETYVNVLLPNSENLFLVTKSGAIEIQHGSKIETNSSWKTDKPVTLGRSFLLFGIELRTIINMLRTTSRCDCFIINQTRGSELFPQFILKLLGKKVILITGGTPSLCVRMASNRSFKDNLLFAITFILEQINYLLVDRIVISSELELLDKPGLSRQGRKVFAHKGQYIDRELFSSGVEPSKRSKSIGYLGRFAKEKGIENFLKSMNILYAIDSEVRFMIMGDGPLMPMVKEAVEGLPTGVATLVGFVLRNDLPNYLQGIRVVVIPSYTEGLPNAMLEAMACRAIVLATPVGAIPSVIIDGGTGFILADNSPSCIANNIIRIFNRSDVDAISQNAIDLLSTEFSMQSAINKFQKLLESL